MIEREIEERGQYRWSTPGEPQRTLYAKVAGVPSNAGPDRPADAGSLGMDDGLSSRMDRLRMLGNSVCPRVAAHALRTLADRTGLMVD